MNIIKKISFSFLFLCTVGCIKKTDPVNCYFCIHNDSLASNIPNLVSPHFHNFYGTNCNWTESLKNLQLRENTKVDTYYKSNDTLEMEYWTMSCTIAY